MAHTCPSCQETCYCNGDVDDILWDEDSEESDNCHHCPVDDPDEEDYSDG